MNYGWEDKQPDNNPGGGDDNCGSLIARLVELDDWGCKFNGNVMPLCQIMK